MEGKEKEKKNHLCVLHHHLLELLQALSGLFEFPLLPRAIEVCLNVMYSLRSWSISYEIQRTT